ncbi:MAG: hypothetical protein HN404_27335 [Gemmatimonadetes bacterium]|nr:hypothetical protein [Gemmatimonadota bacterium]
MPSRELPARASLENLRKQAKGLHKAFNDGDDDAVARIREHLPRAAALSDEELHAAKLSLQEAQHVLAKEYGQGSWDDLRAALATAGFEDLSRLNDRETQTLMRAISQKDLSRAIIGASHALRGRFLSNMSRRVRRFVVEESERLAQDLPDHEPAVSRQRLIEFAEGLAENGQIQWPPPDGAEPFVGELDLGEPPAQNQAEDPLGGLSFEEIEVADLAGIYAELATVARRDGILALEAYLPPGRQTRAFQEGVRLAVDGTQPELIESILRIRTETMVRNRRTRLEMIVDGITSLQAGDNPWIIFHKMQVHYLDAGVAEALNRCREEITGDELRDWVERGWLGVRTPGDLAVTFLHLGFAARNEGIQALAPATGLIQQPLLKTGLEQLITDRDRAELRADLTRLVEAEIEKLEGHHRAAAAGLLAVAMGRTSQEAAQAVIDAAA